LTEKEKTFDILTHNLVPQHTILSENEKLALFEKYKIASQQLPKILSSDVVVKAVGAKHGDVLKILRKSMSPTTSIMQSTMLNI